MPHSAKNTKNTAVNYICKTCNYIKNRHTSFKITFLLSFYILLHAAVAGKHRINHAQEEVLEPPNPTEPLPPSPSKLGRFTKSAVCLDGAQCVDIGKRILLMNGSAVDAMIAVMLCNGMVNMQSMSLGGGFFMIIYKKDESKIYVINARETAPLRARNTLYQNQPDATSVGPLSVAVPGELKGYYAAHQKFGKLPWKVLVKPTIDLCENGYSMTNHQYKSLKLRRQHLSTDINFQEWFQDSEGNFKPPGSRIIPTRLCETLRILADNGPNDFYIGDISRLVLEDIKEAGGIITEQDLRDYEIEWEEPYELTLRNGDTLYSVPPPASGAILAFILNTLEGYNFTRDSIDDTSNTVTTFHRIIEVFKYAYAKRTEMGDPKFANIKGLLEEIASKTFAENIRRKIKDGETRTDPEYYGGEFFENLTDHGTSHLNLVAPDGDAVSVTSSLNIFFGAGMTSKRTGIVLNSQMDDFSYPWKINYFGLPGSPSNQMRPGKRPLSSMCPTIIVDSDNNVKLVVGGAGGSQITSSVALTLIRMLWFGDTIKSAIDAPRIHHQLVPMEVNYEYGILEQVVNGLKAIGHIMKKGVKSNVCGLHVDKNYVYGNADFRKGGDVLGFD